MTFPEVRAPRAPSRPLLPARPCAQLARRLLALGAVALVGCHKPAEEEARPEPLKVRTAAVTRGDVPRIVEAAGTLEPPPGMDVKLGPLIAGRLGEVLVAEGDRVKAGQTLARLDPSSLRDAAAQAEAQVSQARAQEQNARAKLERAQKAFSAGVAAGQEVDDAKLGDATSAAALRTAQAQLSTARNQLGRSELKAPFAGVVAHIFAAPGEPVDAGKPVVEVARTTQLELRATVTPGLAALLRPGQRAELRIDGFSGEPAHGQVLAVAPVIDPATGTALVRVRVDNKDGVLKGGSFAHVRIESGVHLGVLRVPHDSLVRGEDGTSVATVAQGKVKRQPVEVGYEDERFAEITKGLEGTEQVILQGAYALPDGTAVTAEAEGAVKGEGADKAGADKEPGAAKTEGAAKIAEPRKPEEK